MENKYNGYCFVCGKGSFAPYIYLRKNSLEAARCLSCGFVYVTNSPITPSNIADFYTMDAYKGKRVLQETHLYETYYKNAFVGYDEQDLTIRQFAGIIQDIRGLLGNKRDASLLDVGCATGVFLDLARKEKFFVKGVEVSKDLAEYARKEFCLEVYNDLIDAAFPPESFDVVTMLDVIEHIPPSLLSAIIGDIYRILKPGGVLVIRTPAEDALLRGIAKFIFLCSRRKIEFPMHFFYSYEHILSFSSKTLAMLIMRFGFKPCLSRREEENPDRLNMHKIFKTLLRISYIFSGAFGREHKILQYYKKDKK